MKPHFPIPASGARPPPRADVAVLAVAIMLMLAGVVMIFAGLSAGIAIPAIAVGVAMTAILRMHNAQR
jgi:hypothetical protein